MPNRKSGGCRCCPGGNPSPCQTNCIKVNGPDLSGLTATLLGTLNGQPWSIDVALDSNGLACYTPTSAPYPVISQARVTSPYCSYTTPLGNPFNLPFTNVNGVCTATFWYCSRRARVKYTAHPKFMMDFQGLNGGMTDDGSTRTYSECYLSTTNPGASYFNPRPVSATSFSHYGTSGEEAWLGNCASGVVPCGGVVDLDITQVDYSANYFLGGDCPGEPCEGNRGPCNRGLVPKRIQVKLEKIATFSNPYGLNPWADDDGVWIDLYGTKTAGGEGGSPLAVTYDSGCRGGQGNRVYFPSTQLNTPSTAAPVDTSSIAYQSTRVVFSFQVGGSSGGTYYRIPQANCGPITSKCQNVSAPNCFGVRSADGTELCSQCNHNISFKVPLCAGKVNDSRIIYDDSGRPLQRFSIRELGCGGSDPYTTNPYDSTGGPDGPATAAMGYDGDDPEADGDGNLYSAE